MKAQYGKNGAQSTSEGTSNGELGYVRAFLPGSGGMQDAMQLPDYLVSSFEIMWGFSEIQVIDGGSVHSLLSSNPNTFHSRSDAIGS